ARAIAPRHNALDGIARPQGPQTRESGSLTGRNRPQRPFPAKHLEVRVIRESFNGKVDLGSRTARRVVQNKRPAALRLHASLAVGFHTLMNLSSRPYAHGRI